MVELIFCFLLEIPDSFFHLAVLEASIHSIVRYHMDLLREFLLECVVCEAAIVCMAMLDSKHVRPAVSLKNLLCFYRLFL